MHMQMDRTPFTVPAAGHRPAPRPLLAAACALVLAGCGGGSGDSIGLGGGQGPDPGTIDFPIAYVKRSLPAPPMTFEDDARVMRAFNVDADLFIRDRASPSVPERNITQRITGDTELWDVKDVEASYDGKLVVFAMRGPFDPNAQEEDQPKWAIWEYNRETDVLRRVIASDSVADEGHDVAPCYLPDGRIVFTSTRQRQSRGVLLDENKPQYEAQDENRNEPAFVLHVMDPLGTDIRQISFNQSHDRDPSVLASGQVVFSRWDNAPGAASGISLYRANPDGTGLELYYGANSHATGPANAQGNPTIIQFLQPRAQQNGRIMAVLRPFIGTDFGGDIVSIDVQNYVENTQPTLPNRGVLSGPAQTRAVLNDVRTVPGSPSPGGLFSAAFPLHDGTQRMFVSWSQCRLLEGTRIVPCTPDRLNGPNPQPAPPLYGIWIYDAVTGTQLPVVAPEEGVMFTDVVTMQPRALPAVILDKVSGIDLDADLVAEQVGLLDIKSVYDIDGADTANPNITVLADPAVTTADERPARFLRIEKAVSIPDEEVLDFRQSAFGASNFMRDILAYAPIEPDGSIRIKVPANVPLAISILDRNGRRIGPRHTNWLQVRPGEVVQCNGCHNPNANPAQSHGRSNLFAAVNLGAPTTGQPFPNTDPALFADFGETMAQVRARHSCTADNCSALAPSVNVVYTDVWTHEPSAGRPPDASFSYAYANLQTTPPTSAECQTRWSGLCRITINYEQHVHPLWVLPRLVLDPVDPTIVLQDNTCTSCHSPRDAANAVRVPAGQLDLSGDPSTDEPDHFVSFRELLFTDNRQTLNMGALVDECAQTDPVTGLCVAFFTVSPSMSAAGANASTTFFSRFDNGGGTVDHRGFLSTAEMRLIAEWLDIGAQYYNNPFQAPLN